MKHEPSVKIFLMKIVKKIENFDLTTFSVAPMLDWTDKHCRYFMRLMTKHACFYTEMITTGAILFGNPDRHLLFHPAEKPLVLQLGGSDSQALAKCAKIGQEYGYDEINLNIGCPSSRVQSGLFGACLMKNPPLVADCVKAMQDSVTIPVTVKTRTGVDDQDSLEHLYHFIETVSRAGCQKFIIHARKAWLKGLSPKENREIPPLNYAVVSQCKSQFPSLHFILNGGIKSLIEAKQLLEQYDGVMLGRASMHSPFLLNTVDQEIFHEVLPAKTREEILDIYKGYIRGELKKNVPLRILLRPLMGLYFGTPGAKKWREWVASTMPKLDF
jgi:tRNA-dihydrouridine synthase A